MTSRRNPKLKEFVTDVRLARPSDQTIVLLLDLAVAAADFIDARLTAASKGGKARKPKNGRPIVKKTRSAELNRARVRKHREKKQQEEKSTI